MTGPPAASLAVLLAGAAGAAWPALPARLSRAHRPVPPGRAAHGPRTSSLGRWPWVVTVAVAALVLVVSRSVLLAGTAVVGVATATTAASAAVAGRRAAARRSAALEVVGGLVAELRAGQETRSALVAAATAAALPEVAAAARSPASSPVAALDAAGRLPGGDLLRDLAATWRAGEVTGAALATAVGRLAAGARADEAVRRELAAAVAGPRSTMHLLCVLPAFGLLLGGALGADPLGFLVGSTVGQAVLLAGVALVAAGSAWTRALLGRAEGP